MMSSPPQYPPQSPPQSPLSPQEYETPTIIAQNQVQSIDSEEPALEEKKTTLPHVYHILEPPPLSSQPPVYVNESEIRHNQDSGVYASLASNATMKTATATASPQDHHYAGNSKTGGDLSPAQECGIATKILKALMVALVIVLLVVAIVISIAALVLALREQTCECTQDLDSLFITSDNQRSRISQLEGTVAQLQSLLERVEKVEEQTGMNTEQLDLVSSGTGAVNFTLNQKIDNVASRVKDLNERVLDGVNIWNCTTNIEESCQVSLSRRNCITPPVNYQTDQRVIDFSCVDLSEEEPSQVTSTLSATAILNSNNTLVCQCSFTALSDQNLIINPMCGMKVTRCTQISITLR